MAYHQTLYEIAIEKDRTRILLCYASGTPSRRVLIRVMRKRVDRLDWLTGGADWQILPTAADGIQAGPWRVRYTRRTQLEAQQSGELPYLTEDGSIA